MSRWPSLLAKIACSTLIAAIPFAFGFVVTAGGSLAAPGADGRAAEEPVLVWAEAADAISIAAAIRKNTNLGFMRLAKLLGELLLIFPMRNFFRTGTPGHTATPRRAEASRFRLIRSNWERRVRTSTIGNSKGVMLTIIETHSSQ